MNLLPRDKWVPCPICKSMYDGVSCNSCRNKAEPAAKPERQKEPWGFSGYLEVLPKAGAAPSVQAEPRDMHKTVPLKVWADVDEGIAPLVRYLNTIPGVRTLASCQGTIGEGGPNPYRAQVMAQWTAEAGKLLAEQFDITLLGDNWGYVHPREGWMAPSVQEHGELLDALKVGCAARKAGTAGGNDPQDCDWPFCGCDTQATKVMETLLECGWIGNKEAAQFREDVSRLQEERDGLENLREQIYTESAKWRKRAEAAESRLKLATEALRKIRHEIALVPITKTTLLEEQIIKIVNEALTHPTGHTEGETKCT